MIYEVIACSLEDALAAERGGANRLELISHYEAGGLTPGFDLVRSIVETVRIPVRVMLREEESFEIRDEKKRERLCEAARSFQDLPIEGLVLGFLRGRELDHELVTRLLACAPTRKVTFHRAFEEAADPLRAIAELKRHSQIDCILTSGGPEPWAAKLDRFEQWRRASRPEIEMLAGGGTDAEAIELFGRRTAIRAFHVGRAVREGQRLDGPVREDRVRELARLIQLLE